MSQKRRPHYAARHQTDLNRGQLGLPTPEREGHAREGFEVKQLAVGHGWEGGVVQSRERAILTHPQLLYELRNAMVKQYQDRGEEIPHRIHIKQTPSDRATEGINHYFMWSYIQTHLEVLRGDINISDYEGAPRSSELHRLPRSLGGDKKKFDNRRFYAWVRDQTGLAVVTNLLDRVAVHDNPGLTDDSERVLNKYEIGRYLLGKELTCQNCGGVFGIYDVRGCKHCGNAIHTRDRDAENAFYGALSMCARVLGEAAQDFQVVEKRRIDTLRLAMNKKIA